MTSHDIILKQLSAIFIAENIESMLVAGTENSPPQLLVYLGQDHAKRDRTLTISALHQLPPGSPNKPETPLLQYARIQFEVILPFQMQSKMAYDIGSLLHFINRSLELPGFEMDEVENTLKYRYVLLSNDPASTPSLHTSILGIILLIQDVFVETIERVATGETTFNEILKEVAAISKQIKPV